MIELISWSIKKIKNLIDLLIFKQNEKFVCVCIYTNIYTILAQIHIQYFNRYIHNNYLKYVFLKLSKLFLIFTTSSSSINKLKIVLIN